jgi:hypothetical protein
VKNSNTSGSGAGDGSGGSSSSGGGSGETGMNSGGLSAFESEQSEKRKTKMSRASSFLKEAKKKKLLTYLGLSFSKLIFFEIFGIWFGSESPFDPTALAWINSSLENSLFIPPIFTKCCFLISFSTQTVVVDIVVAVGEGGFIESASVRKRKKKKKNGVGKPRKKGMALCCCRCLLLTLLKGVSKRIQHFLLNWELASFDSRGLLHFPARSCQQQEKKKEREREKQKRRRKASYCSFMVCS